MIELRDEFQNSHDLQNMAKIRESNNRQTPIIKWLGTKIAGSPPYQARRQGVTTVPQLRGPRSKGGPGRGWEGARKDRGEKKKKKKKGKKKKGKRKRGEKENKWRKKKEEKKREEEKKKKEVKKGKGGRKFLIIDSAKTDIYLHFVLVDTLTLKNKKHSVLKWLQQKSCLKNKLIAISNQEFLGQWAVMQSLPFRGLIWPQKAIKKVI